MRARRLDLRPRGALILVAAASAAIHGLLSLAVRAPLFSPDEWLYALLSRSFVQGHPGEIHGGRVPIGTTISYAGPLISSPVWLVHDVAVAYHLGLLLASVAFALATFPAYALARRVGLRPRAGLVAAALSQLIPAGAFTATLLAEPYAYPALLAAVVLGLDALVRPTVRRIAAVAAASAALCFVGGFQFLVFPAAWIAAWAGSARSLRSAARRALLACGAVAAFTAALELAGAGSLVSRIVTSAQAQHYPVGSLAGWLGVNAVVLALASGWVIVPAACVGVARLLRERDTTARCFGWLTLSLVAGFLVEAAIWGANGNGLYERFTFYATPLLLVAFLREVGRHADRGRVPYAIVAYAAAAAAILTPLTADLFKNEGHSPTLLGLADDHVVRVVWPPLFALLAVAAAAVGPARGRLLLVLGAVVLAATAASGFRTLLHYQTSREPSAGAPVGSALLASPVQVNYDVAVLKVLFWNPNVRRLAILGGGASPDPAPALQATLAGHEVRTRGGAVVPGPFVVGDGVSAWRGTRLLAAGSGPVTLAATPDVVAFGWANGLLSPVAEIVASGDPSARRRLVIELRAAGAPTRLNVRCDSGGMSPRTVAIPRHGGAALVVHVPAGGAQRCRLSLAPGAGAFQEETPAARARLVAASP